MRANTETSMIRRVVRTAAAALLTLGAFSAQACSDALGPDDFAGTYQLERYEGMTLPAVQARVGVRTFLIVSQRVVLGDNRRGVILTTSRTLNDGAPEGPDVSISSEVGFVVRDGHVEVTIVCPPNAGCIAGPHYVGGRVAGGLALAWPASSKPASIYKRIG